jgi:hypothetical protein
LSGQRDFQRSRVYAWENRVVAPRDQSLISFPDAQAMVNAIWSEMGLKYPPKVEPLSTQAKATVASASRLSIFLPERTPSWCLLHEIAHAMTSTIDGESDGHGGLFMGVYVRLLARYLRLDPAELVRSVRSENIQIEPNAGPVFLDP